MQKVFAIFLPVLIFFSLVEFGGAQPPGNPKPPPPAMPTPTPPQEAKAPPCPNVSVQPQAQMFRDGQPITFSLNIVNGDPSVQPTINWSTTAGTIVKGQYTNRIEVDSTGSGSLPEREIKAEVFISGYASECIVQASTVVKIVPPAVKFGDFGEIGADGITKNLKHMADVLAQSPDNLTLVVYAGRTSERGYTSLWAKKLKDELTANGVNIRRINALDGGFREQPIFEFWLVPLGAEQPRPTPTIKREEIVYPKLPPKKP